jgi:hypothetical protein
MTTRLLRITTSRSTDRIPSESNIISRTLFLTHLHCRADPPCIWSLPFEVGSKLTAECTVNLREVVCAGFSDTDAESLSCWSRLALKISGVLVAHSQLHSLHLESGGEGPTALVRLLLAPRTRTDSRMIPTASSAAASLPFHTSLESETAITQ